jgi:hypothetical protein
MSEIAATHKSLCSFRDPMVGLANGREVWLPAETRSRHKVGLEAEGTAAPADRLGGPEILTLRSEREAQDEEIGPGSAVADLNEVKPLHAGAARANYSGLRTVPLHGGIVEDPRA